VPPNELEVLADRVVEDAHSGVDRKE
jgi:hypothetical protein